MGILFGNIFHITSSIQKLLELDESQPFSTSAKGIPHSTDVMTIAKFPKKAWKGNGEGQYFQPASPDLLRTSKSLQQSASLGSHCHVTVENASFSWSSKHEKMVLQDVSFEVKIVSFIQY